MSEATEALTVQFLAWIDARERNYAETMEAWRTSCPRLSIWEDAVNAGLVEIAGDRRRPMRAAIVRLTARGRLRLSADGARAGAATGR